MYGSVSNSTALYSNPFKIHGREMCCRISRAMLNTGNPCPYETRARDIIPFTSICLPSRPNTGARSIAGCVLLVQQGVTQVSFFAFVLPYQGFHILRHSPHDALREGKVLPVAFLLLPQQTIEVQGIARHDTTRKGRG